MAPRLRWDRFGIFMVRSINRQVFLTKVDVRGVGPLGGRFIHTRSDVAYDTCHMTVFQASIAQQGADSWQPGFVR